MAALNLHSAALAAVMAAGAFVLIPAVGWAKDTPDPNGQPQNAPAQNGPPAVEPKPPAPGETKTGVIRPPEVDPGMSKTVPDVDPKMPKPIKPQAPGQGQGNAAPETQPR